MAQESTPPPLVFHHPIIVRQERDGRFTAEAVGIPEIRATDRSENEAVAIIRRMLNEWMARGRLSYVAVTPMLPNGETWERKPVDPNDPWEQEYMAELALMKKEDLEQTLREYEMEDQKCSNSPLTPTT